jgi:hypothetical protein
MSKTSCDLRVLMRFNDGTIGVYAVDDIPSASRMRDELAACGEAFSDLEAAEDCLPEGEWPATVGLVFKDTHSALTRTSTATDDSCPHWSATGEDQSTGDDKVYVCDACGARFRTVRDADGFDHKEMLAARDGRSGEA